MTTTIRTPWHTVIPLQGTVPPEAIDLSAIPAVLGQIPRWVGGRIHGALAWSVLDHSALVAALAARRDPMAGVYGLIHDAHEAVTGDIPAPLLATAPEVVAFQARVQTAIMLRAGLAPISSTIAAIVDDADRRAREWESTGVREHLEGITVGDWSGWMRRDRWDRWGAR